MQSAVPTRLRSTVARIASASASANEPMWNDPPAFANRMSRPPVRSDATRRPPRSAPRPSRRRRPNRSTRHRRGPRRSRPPRRRSFSSVRPQIVTCAPSPREPPRRREPDAAPAARDERRPSVDPLRSHPPTLARPPPPKSARLPAHGAANLANFRLGVEYGPGGGARHGRGAPAAAGPAAPPRPRGPRGRYGGHRRRPRRATRDRSGDGVPERARP